MIQARKDATGSVPNVLFLHNSQTDSNLTIK